jgi:serine/threonine-protein kinase
VIKILDMGLARLIAEDEDKSTLTQVGKLVGTPDYIAPEQARNSHNLDIRADLYSLGCTFYFLLSGRVPFPGGSGVEKVIRHRIEEPVPVEKLRTEVPTAVVGIVRKLMAKRPKERYQTPAELVDALVEVMGLQGRRSALAPVASAPAAIPVPVGLLAPSDPAENALKNSPNGMPVPPTRKNTNSWNRPIWIMLIGLLILGGLGLLIWLLAGEHGTSHRKSENMTPHSARAAAIR